MRFLQSHRPSMSPDVFLYSAVIILATILCSFQVLAAKFQARLSRMLSDCFCFCQLTTPHSITLHRQANCFSVSHPNNQFCLAFLDKPKAEFLPRLILRGLKYIGDACGGDILGLSYSNHPSVVGSSFPLLKVYGTLNVPL